jgi:Tol biopolymer transport system component
MWPQVRNPPLRRALEEVNSVAFAPDGRHVLTGSGDGKARLWDVATGKELRTFEGHSDWVMSVAFSPDGQQALTGSADKTARLWDVETGQEIRRLQHADGVRCVAFSPDGQQVLTGSFDNTARLWDVTTGREIRRFEGHSDAVVSVAFSPDGRQVVTGSWDSNCPIVECGHRPGDPPLGRQRGSSGRARRQPQRAQTGRRLYCFRSKFNGRRSRTRRSLVGFDCRRPDAPARIASRPYFYSLPRCGSL